MPRIATAATLFGITSADEYHHWIMTRGSVQQRLRQIDMRASSIGTPSTPNTSAAPALAYVNHGRWVADCPTAFCGGSMVLLNAAPYMCGGCLNAEAGYRYRLVQWPDERPDIEAILAARLLPETANWRPGESIDRLALENEVH